MKITETITIPLINLEVLLLIGHKNKKSVIKSLHKSSVELANKLFSDDDFYIGSDACYIHYTNKENPFVGYHVLKFDNCENEDFNSNVVHEVIHLLQRVRKIFWGGHQEREFEAYIGGFMFTEIQRIINKKRK